MKALPIADDLAVFQWMMEGFAVRAGGEDSASGCNKEAFEGVGKFERIEILLCPYGCNQKGHTLILR